MSFLSSGWIVVVLAFFITGSNIALNRLKENDGPVLGIRSLQALLVVATGLMLYFGVRIFVG
jgi:predicted permease